MRTARVLTVSQSMLLGGVSGLGGGRVQEGVWFRGGVWSGRCLVLRGVSAPRGLSALGGVWSRRVSGQGGCLLLGGLLWGEVCSWGVSGPGGVWSGAQFLWAGGAHGLGFTWAHSWALSRLLGPVTSLGSSLNNGHSPWASGQLGKAPGP